MKWGFEQSSRGNSLGSSAAKFVLHRLRPARWFSAHLHVKFTGSVVHSDRPDSNGQSQNRRSAFGLDENYVSSSDSLGLVENDMSETAVGAIETTSLTTLNADNQDSTTVKDCQVSDTLVIDEVSVMKPEPGVPHKNMLQDNDKFGQRAVQGDRGSRISAQQNFHAVASKQEAEATALYRKEMDNKEREAEKAPDFNYQLTWRKANVGQDSSDRKISAVEKMGFEEEPGNKRPKLESKTVVKNTDEISLDSDTDSDTAPPITELAVCPEAITNKITNFLALDKCVRGHEFLCLDEITVISDPDGIQTERPYRLQYDKEWLAITRVFAEDLILGDPTATVSLDKGGDYYRQRIIEEEAWVEEHVVQAGKLAVPENFVPTAPYFDPYVPITTQDMPPEYNNPQTEQFCDLVGVKNKFHQSEEESQCRMSADQSGPR